MHSEYRNDTIVSLNDSREYLAIRYRITLKRNILCLSHMACLSKKLFIYIEFLLLKGVNNDK
jgi:hypothetical protein